ncbi:MAG: cyclic nucleotide-binding domain-containing protein [Gammaproteobacteria bacterium]|jgi:CRP-like cAMP-binding protein|nr:cyclic nucleotide-binding domain-containing protein [Gammaproteobacteria bacterium]MBT4087617.1 cyclic nucleotide-binding domain-containing protein [Deltaproteobacteria bacterium]MBT3723049.1 cyclic nucleotide-binding domain-containing protein [Gammaproteobacteria bacterium]MBT4196748.1 cyclic nucleotide-binding domain-containing protein [Gammaproteobacteria bacterium]MBT4451867.1 cyclic nucleotide-binding domain-containing protein [Gammaproteobacteria bacterium]
MRQNRLGHLYHDGDVIFHKGDQGNSMFLIQKGTIEIIIDETSDSPINTLSDGDFFGEMSLFTGNPRSATVRSKGESYVLTIDELAFMLRIKEDPMLAFRILDKLYARIHSLNIESIPAKPVEA